MGTLRALEPAAGEAVRACPSEQAGSATASDHQQVPQPPGEELLARDTDARGAGTTPLGGKASKPYLILPPLPSLLLLNNFSSRRVKQ